VKFEHLPGHGWHDHRNLSGDEVGEGGARPSIGHVDEVGDARHQFERFPSEVVYRAGTGGAVGNLLGLALA